MGNYGSLKINNFSVSRFKNHVPDFVSMIYTHDDRKYYYVDEFGDRVVHETNDIGRSLISNCITIYFRLQILGYNDDLLESEFSNGIYKKLLELSKSIGYSHDSPKRQKDIYRELRFWEDLTLEELERLFKAVIFPDAQLHNGADDNNSRNTVTYFLYLLQQYQNDLILLLPFNYYLFSLLFAISCCEPDYSVEFDYTDLYESDYVEDNEVVNDSVVEKIIIIAEGVSDINILKSSLQLLYPSLAHFYSFFDFSSFNNSGGTGNLVNMIKAFAGAGVSNRIIALFDNDTAAKEAQRNLKNIKLPSHIKVLHYPNITLAENYPTIGPTGLITMNINGLAGSIELYLGEDVLKSQDGSLTAVQWTGYSVACNSYQGEIMNKKELQIKFNAKLEKLKIDRDESLKTSDWDGLNKIFDTIFEAFDEGYPKHLY